MAKLLTRLRNTVVALGLVVGASTLLMAQVTPVPSRNNLTNPVVVGNLTMSATGCISWADAFIQRIAANSLAISTACNQTSKDASLSMGTLVVGDGAAGGMSSVASTSISTFYGDMRVIYKTGQYHPRFEFIRTGRTDGNIWQLQSQGSPGDDDDNSMTWAMCNDARSVCNPAQDFLRSGTTGLVIREHMRTVNWVSPGPHVIGETVNLTGTGYETNDIIKYTGTYQLNGSGTGHGFYYNQTLNLTNSVNDSAYGFEALPVFVGAGSGTHSVIGGARFAIPTYTGAATVTKAVTLTVEGAPAFGGTNLAFEVLTGLSKLSGGATVTGTLTVTEDTNPNLTIFVSGGDSILRTTNGSNFFAQPDGETILGSNQSSRVGINAGGIYPLVNNTYTDGTNANRWSNVYSVLGNFSGAVTLTSGIVGGCTGTPTAATAGVVTTCSEPGEFIMLTRDEYISFKAMEAQWKAGARH